MRRAPRHGHSHVVEGVSEERAGVDGRRRVAIGAGRFVAVLRGRHVHLELRAAAAGGQLNADAVRGARVQQRGREGSEVGERGRGAVDGRGVREQVVGGGVAGVGGVQREHEVVGGGGRGGREQQSEVAEVHGRGER